MKNTMKIMLALLTSVSLVTSATAGELTVSGTAKATYNMLSGGSAGALNNSGKSLGITNEIDFGAKGELDNGMTWNYQVQFDPSTAGAGTVDDTRLELTTSYGTLGLYVLEGGLDTDNAASQSVYGRPTDIGLASGITDGPGIDTFNNIQIHTPAGLLPFGLAVKAAFAPGNSSKTNSGNGANTGIDNDRFVGNSTTQIQVKAAPIDGLSIGADFYEKDGQGFGAEQVIQKNQAGSVYATYASGPMSFGISRTLVAPLMLGTNNVLVHADGTVGYSAFSNTGTGEGNVDAARQYTNNKMSVAFNVNDQLSLSYEVEKSERELIVNAAENDIKAQAVQAAYTMGGMTLSVSHGNVDNASYTANNDTSQTLLAMTMAF
mgnify:FL=1